MRTIYPTSADWNTVNLDDGACLINGHLAELTYPGLWLACVGAWSPLLDSHPFNYAIESANGVRSSALKDTGGRWLITSADSITIPHNYTFQDYLTISLWVTKIANETPADFIRNRNVESGFELITLNADRQVQFRTGKANFTGTANSTGRVEIGALNHICGTYNTNIGRKLYLNGKLDVSDSVTNQFAMGSTDIVIGKSPTLTGMSGHYEDIRLYSRTLTADEVQLLAIEPNIAYQCRTYPTTFFVKLPDFPLNTTMYPELYLGPEYTDLRIAPEYVEL